MNELMKTTITSLEVAEMVGKRHTDLMRDVRRYLEQFNESNLASVEFFRANTYKDSKGEIRPCYDVTKKGCEFIAHKLTGVKGTEFTAKYINRFHEMEEGKIPCPLNPNIASGVADLGRVTERIMKNQGSAPYKIAETFKMQCEQFGIHLPDDFVKVPEYEQMRFPV